MRERKFLHDVTFLTVYGENKIKVTTCKTVRNSGVEDEFSAARGVNETKLENNISRARSTIYELALCNQWDFFCTFTLNPKKYDRYDLQKYRSDLSRWIRNQRRSTGDDIAFLLVPEMHKDGAWHLHGFVRGLSLENVEPFRLDQKLPNYIRDKLSEGSEVFNWPAYSEKFGFCDLERVRSHERAAKYVTKYISKELSRSVTDLGAHLYYCSRGLERADCIRKGRLVTEPPDGTWKFENDYCKVVYYDYSPETLSELSGIILSE